ncbi:efflux transporter outer membrane subunit [Massilia sp. CFBP9012]|uniref:efflux transporter outer membrane subunit n=1 Tax=Massilia sp. CFBP9012 TaxID=3096531 RepID=UPI002A6A22CC|nr:efflux transporter outer membrane subunit [Massilia sp. CFBP9012]MDY0973786.1 efflux transporter outer membrane subunit [Massilia sp. CFBP9012]
MSKLNLSPIMLALSLALGGCGMLQPELPQAQANIPFAWPEAPTAAADAAPADSIGWRDFFTDPKLVSIIASALENNRDLREAALNVERTRALYKVQRADRLPSVGLSVAAERSGGSGAIAAATPDVVSAGVGISTFELDLFGRVHNLSEAALQQYLAQEEARRAVQISLIGEIANVYLTLAADIESLRVAQATLDDQQALFELIVKRQAIGAVSGLDVEQARTTVETARADAAQFAGLVATGRNQLALLAGSQVAEALLPAGFDVAVSGLAPLPVGLASDVLLRRPDVRQAEYVLRAANANIGAARAAFFPSVTLTGSLGSASDELSGLFESGTRLWRFAPSVNLPIFQGGRLTAQLGVAQADRDIALARYERAIQSGFRDVADALALTRTLDARRAARQSLLDAAERTHRLSKERYDRGLDSYLVLLDAQRTLYSAQQGLIGAQLAEQDNRVRLYRVLGGGWNERMGGS